MDSSLQSLPRALFNLGPRWRYRSPLPHARARSLTRRRSGPRPRDAPVPILNRASAGACEVAAGRTNRDAISASDDARACCRYRLSCAPTAAVDVPGSLWILKPQAVPNTSIGSVMPRTSRAFPPYVILRMRL